MGEKLCSFFICLLSLPVMKQGPVTIHLERGSLGEGHAGNTPHRSSCSDEVVFTPCLSPPYNWELQMPTITRYGRAQFGSHFLRTISQHRPPFTPDILLFLY